MKTELAEMKLCFVTDGGKLQIECTVSQSADGELAEALEQVLSTLSEEIKPTIENLLPYILSDVGISATLEEKKGKE